MCSALDLHFQVGAMYVFNLIVGTGALTMPAAFQSSGWVIGLVIVVILAFFRLVAVVMLAFSFWLLW